MPLDIAVGILLAIFVPPHFGAEVTPLLIAYTIFCALIPDLDMAHYLLQKAKSPDHRSWTHYPAIYLPLTALVCVFVGPLYAALFGAGVYLHLIHDTIGLGWGVAWLWPLSPRRFRFLSPLGPGRWELFKTWLPHEQPKFEAIQHDPSWIKTYYLHPHPVGVVEYGALLIALLALYMFFI